MITIDPQAGAPFRQPWRNAIAVGRAYDLLRAELQAHLRRLQGGIGLRCRRFHVVFDDDMLRADRSHLPVPEKPCFHGWKAGFQCLE